MQCSCGGETKEHKITENYKTVLVYDQCASCGRNNYRQRLAQTENSGKRSIKREELLAGMSNGSIKYVASVAV